MIAIALLLARMLCDCFKSRSRLEAELVVLRHQLNVLRLRAPRRLYLRWADRILFVWLYRRFPRTLDAITIVRPETVVRWHRMGFAAYWRWKSRPLGGRPWVDRQIRDLIRRMSFENPLWGAPKIHGELLKLGIEVAQSTVSKYIVPRLSIPKISSSDYYGKIACERLIRPIRRAAFIISPWLSTAALSGSFMRYWTGQPQIIPPTTLTETSPRLPRFHARPWTRA